MQWRDGALFVNELPYEPISFHEEDAQAAAEALGMETWGKKWGKVPHRFQRISAELDFTKTA